MKKKLILLLVLMLTISLFSCGNNTEGNTNDTEENTQEVNVDDTEETEETEVEEVTEEEGDIVEVVKDFAITLELHNIGSKVGKYNGDLVNGVPNGKGKFTTTNSEGVTWWYDGEWIDGQMEGKGVICFPDHYNQTQEGDYVDSVMVYGRRSFDGVPVYEGEWEDGEYKYGTLFSEQGIAAYTGDFKDGKPDEETFKASVVDVPYDSLARDAHLYEGNIIKISGEVIQVLEGDGGYCEYRISIDDWNEKVMYAYYTRQERESRILEGDKVTVYGISEGLITYESTFGSNITIPAMSIFFYSID